jgi:glucose-6-phosphate 1-dehydrogenase
MEPPSKFDPDAVRDEKLKVIRALDPVAPEDIVRGQYRADEDAPSYLTKTPKTRQPDRKLHRAEAACVELALERARPSTCAPASG